MTTSEELEHLLRIAAEVEIPKAIFQLASAIDVGDLADFEALLTKDVVFEMAGIKVHGVDAILASMYQRRAAGTTGPGSGTQHVLSNIEVAITKVNNALAQSVWQFFTEKDGVNYPSLNGTYHDHWIRELDGWRIAERQVVTASSVQA